jgi:hypothetical protein
MNLREKWEEMNILGVNAKRFYKECQ